MAVILLIIIGILSLIYKELKNHNPPAILNIYQQRNGFYWIKFCFMYSVLSLRKLSKKKTDVSDLDRAQPFSTHPNAIDAVYFNGANKQGDRLIVGTARRKNKLVDGFFYLQINDSNLGLLESPKLPATSLYQIEEQEEFSAEGITLKPVIPMKKWTIQYEGEMKRSQDRDEKVTVKIDAIWTSNLPYFNFDTDMSPSAMAKSMAYEKFSREYFDDLKESHQTHYEQYGDITGTVAIDKKIYNLGLNAIRDHSFGKKREWRLFHRYGLHFVSTENGDRFNVGSICMPISFSRLTLGYVYSAKDGKIHPVDWCDLQLYQHGEQGIPPKDYAFSFRAGGQFYTMQVNVRDACHFYISKDCESKICERLADFKVNGVDGWGCAEWQYRNVHEKIVE